MAKKKSDNPEIPEIPEPEPEPETPKPDPELEPEPQFEPKKEPLCYHCNKPFEENKMVMGTGLLIDEPKLRRFHQDCAIHAYARNGWGALFEIQG